MTSDTQFPVEQFEAAVSQSAVPSPPPLNPWTWVVVEACGAAPLRGAQAQPAHASMLFDEIIPYAVATSLSILSRPYHIHIIVHSFSFVFFLFFFFLLLLVIIIVIVVIVVIVVTLVVMIVSTSLSILSRPFPAAGSRLCVLLTCAFAFASHRRTPRPPPPCGSSGFAASLWGGAVFNVMNYICL